MIYGLEDYEEFGLIEQNNKLNKTKVAIAIGVAALLIVLVSFGITMGVNKIKSNNETASEENVGAQENEFESVSATVQETIEEDQDIDDTTYQAGMTAPTIPAPDVVEVEQVSNQTEHMQIPLHSLEDIKKKFVPQFNEDAPNEIRHIYYTDEKVVYLTFDDGPSTNITPQVLEILDRYDVKATFFLVGKRIDANPHLVKQEFEKGHYLANHGYTHEYSKIYTSKDTVLEEYQMCEQSIKNAINNQDYNSYLFRFPGGSSGGRYEKIKSQARAMLNEYGMAYTNWNCLTGDAEGKTTPEACFDYMVQTKGNQDGIILLMHDASDKQQTVDSLPQVIEYFKNEGYTFKTFYDIFR